MIDREAILLRAMGDALRDKLARLTPGASRVEFPAPQVHTQVAAPQVHVTNDVGVPTVNVAVDLTPIAAAIDRMSEALALQMTLLTRLVETLKALPTPHVEMKPILRPPAIQVEAPQVTVEAPVAPERERRRFRITHDGDKTYVEEV